MMYNQDLKQEYIDWKKSCTILPFRKLERVFENIAKREEELNKDCCNFSRFEIEEYYKELNMPNINSIADYHSTLKVYADWCFNKNLITDGQNHYSEIVRKDYKLYVNKTAEVNRVITEEELEKWIRTLVNPCDRFVLRAIWEGICGKGYIDIVKLQLSDFKDGKVKTFSGKEKNYSERLYQLAKASSEQKIYEVNNGLAKGSIREYNLHGDTVVRANVSIIPYELDEDLHNIRRRIGLKIKNIFSYVGVEKWMTATSIRDSSILSYIKEIEKKENLSADEILARGSVYRDYIKNQYDVSEVKVLMSQYKEYM